MRVTRAPSEHTAPVLSVARETKIDRPFAAVLNEHLNETAAPPRDPRPVEAQTTPGRALIVRALAAETKVDALLEAAARGKTFSAAELLALQATVFRYSQTVEIVSRVADRLVGAIKQTMSTQV